MEVWLKLGVDGFYIRGLGDFYMGDGNLQYGAMHGYLNGWQTLLQAHETYLGARVLMVEGSYMKKVERDQPSIVGPLLNFIHLIDEPLVLNTVNLTYSLQVEHFVDILRPDDSCTLFSWDNVILTLYIVSYLKSHTFIKINNKTL